MHPSPASGHRASIPAVCLSACLTAWFAVPAAAQSTIVIPNGTAALEGDDFNNFPMGRGGTGLLHQCIYDPVNFTAQGITTPIIITRLRWRPDDMRSSVTSSYGVGATVRLATCPLASTAVTTTFANQRGPDSKIVYSGPVSWPAFPAVPGPCPFRIDIPLTSPFTYNPAAGGLTIEVDLPIQGFSGTTPLQLDVKTFGANASRVWLSSGYVNGGANATTTFTPQSPHGVVVELTYSLPGNFASVDAYGAGCYDVPRSVYELFSPGTFDLSGSGMSMLFNAATGTYVCVPAVATYVPPSGAATLLNLADDNEVTVNLGSVLQHPGGSTNQLTICSNGYVSAGPNGSSNFPTVSGFLGFAETVWAADWRDYNPFGLGSGRVKFEEVGAISYVTWDGVFTFAGNTPNTFQLQFDRGSHNVHVLWPNIQGSFAHLVGFKVGGATLDPGNQDLSTLLQQVFTCARDERSLHLAASARPVTGTTIQLDTTHAGAGTLGLNLLSATLHNPGFDLSAIGMPTCFLLVGPELRSSLHFFPSGGGFSTPLAVPADPVLNGLHVGSQSAILGDILANVAGIRSSNALDLKIGIQ